MVFKQGGILLLSPVIIFVVPCRGTRQFNHLFTKSKDWWEPDLPVIHTHWSFKGRLKFWNFFITALHRQWCMTSPYDLTTDASSEIRNRYGHPKSVWTWILKPCNNINNNNNTWLKKRKKEYLCTLNKYCTKTISIHLYDVISSNLRYFRGKVYW